MNILFHHPLALNETAVSGSGIRPLRMLKAFREAGCNVDVISGYVADRKDAIQRVKTKVKAGYKYDFLYSESSTMPTALTGPHHLPTNPSLDAVFFAFCKRNEITIGLFYRDIYWRFGNYGSRLNIPKFIAAQAFYRFDLLVYQRYVDRLYLPSLEMGSHIPIVSPCRFSALPPGHDEGSTQAEPSTVVDAASKSSLHLFYVGGVSEHYRMRSLFEVVADLPGVTLTVCTRESEWRSVQAEYPALSTNVEVVHESGERMLRRLRSSDIAMLFVEPHEYRMFAAPVKLYEYIGSHKPVIASERTLAGRFVDESGVGWTIPYSKSALRRLLVELRAEPGKVAAMRENCRQVASQHTWRARAEQVIAELTT